MEAVIRAATGIVVVDEAYGAFHHDSFLPWAGEVENLVVMRTISKIGFAGLRMGICGRKSKHYGRTGQNPSTLQHESIKLGGGKILIETSSNHSAKH